MNIVDEEKSTAHGAGPNGAVWAAFMAAGIGAFTMGLVVLLNEAEIFVAPTLYGPAGGVSGRTTIAVALWLIAWVFLHARWRTREVDPGRVVPAVFVLIGLGVLGTFPPVWGLL
jgi:hypothetical protein